jgi:uncharacterized membrane protein YhaH (DUF805 family)
MSIANPYQAPAANLDFSRAEDYSEVKFFSTSGRLGRVRYLTYSIGYGLLFYLLPVIVLSAVLGAVGMMEDESVALAVAGISWVLIIGVGLVLARRRAHDFDKSGWFGLLSLVPLVNLFFLFMPGTDGENRYGKKTPPNRGGAVVFLVGVFVMIAIVGILAAIAIPAYNEYVKRAAESGMAAPAE